MIKKICKKTKIFFFSLFFITQAIFLFAPKVLAAETGGHGGGSYWGGTNLEDIGNLLRHPPADIPQTGYQNIFSVGITLLIIAAILLSLFFLIWGGFDWITSGGDKQKLHQARQKITMAIIGLVIVFLAFFVVNLIYNFFGVGGAGGGGGGGAGPKLY